MKKKLLYLLVIAMFILTLAACGASTEEETETTPIETVSEYVRAVQRKIDKALESTPSYADLKEIRDLYNDLLSAEQKEVVNYDKIEELFTLSPEEAAGVFAVKHLKERLVNPSSLEISFIAVASDGDYHIGIDYSAANKAGGRVEDTYYISLKVPTYDNEKGAWICGLEEIFASKENLELIYGALGYNQKADPQGYAQDNFEDNLKNAVELDSEKIMDNLNISIIEIEE